MSAQHTPGPIRYDYAPGYCGELIASNGCTLATFDDEPSPEVARRLTACWNACEGVRTEILELAGTRQDWCDLMQELEQERNTLLAALKDMADLYDTDEGCRSLPQYKAARAAIAKIKDAKPNQN